MSFTLPKFPNISSASSPSRRTYRETNDTPIRKAYGRHIPTIPRQVDVQIGKKSFQQKPRIKRSRQLDHSLGKATLDRADGDRRAVEHNHWLRILKAALPSYLRLLRTSENLRSIQREFNKDCNCRVDRVSISVHLISFDGTA